jgi:hypothetical protein
MSYLVPSTSQDSQEVVSLSLLGEFVLEEMQYDPLGTWASSVQQEDIWTAYSTSLISETTLKVTATRQFSQKEETWQLGDRVKFAVGFFDL